MKGMRFANEITGAVVLLAVVLFLVAVLQAGVLRNWLNPGATLRILLPPEGSFGLSAGAEVQVLGTRAGEVRGIVIDHQQMHAEARIDDAMKVFVRRDSKALIKKQFGVAGASYLEITRGEGPALDWSYAVIPVQVEKAPTESINQLIEQARALVLPVIEDAHKTIQLVNAIAEGLQDPKGNLQQTLSGVAEIAGRLQRGEGAVGRLLADDKLVRELETTVEGANRSLARMQTILDEVEKSARDLNTVSRNVARQSDAIPEAIRHANALLGTLESVAEDIRRTTPQLPSIARNVDQSTANLPALLIETQQAALELERLLVQLRGHWLLGGAAAAPEPAARVSPLEFRP